VWQKSLWEVELVGIVFFSRWWWFKKNASEQLFNWIRFFFAWVLSTFLLEQTSIQSHLLGGGLKYVYFYPDPWGDDPI